MNNKPRIAIVGAGVGGCSAAYFLRKLKTNFDPELVVFEGDKDGHIGGRLRSVRLENFNVECGGTIFLKDNRYMYSLTKSMGLNHVNLDKDRSRLVIMGDKRHPIAYSDFGWPYMFSSIVLLYRYGWDLYKALRYTASNIKYFSRIYDLQKKGHAFTSTAKFLSALAPDDLFLNMTKTTFSDWLEKEMHLGDRIRDEIAYGLVANNYTQKPQDVHAFVGFLSLATMSPNLMAVKEGNDAVPKALLKKALESNEQVENRSVRKAQVLRVRQNEDKWILDFKELQTDLEKSEQFDYVLICSPLHQNNVIKGPEGIWPTAVQYRNMQVSSALLKSSQSVG
ncbi:Prenylcysteine oxidase-like [Cichlidogyrus casuarinus]|uniref:Prenylcysteine oxidase-like n=1 Tax=Cichlidogyrus casuarinus TaxID=1844966 RepID=A0ABD2QE08_9PLAT